jgi:SAM-dependent methyltransferase
MGDAELTAALKTTLERLRLLGPAFALVSRLRATRLAASSSPLPAEFDDGLPVPPASLLVGVGGATTPAAYLHGGIVVAAAIRDLLDAHSLPISNAGSILDFGCGCGRILRRLGSLTPAVQLHGTDYDAAQITWCREHLPFATFSVNRLAPPLAYPDSAFGLVYSFSVFTHLPADLQEAWSTELRRVSRPGGLAVFTVTGRTEAVALTSAERKRFDAGELVVRYPSVAGSNLCAVFHPRPYIEHTLARGWKVLDIREAIAGQTFVLLQKP